MGWGTSNSLVRERWSEKDTVLITYADMVTREGCSPLSTLDEFASHRLAESFSTIHLLPFYPWSSDDGFSVVNYYEVAIEYGDWEDVEALGSKFDLMFDLVLNHCSRESSWFKDFVSGIEPARHFFLPIDPKTDLSAVVRPRTSPLLTTTQTRDGEVSVWTTFSSDQVDLNWQNPEVLFEFMNILMFYLHQGVRFIRLDAVAFLWKEIGTDCLHLPQTHEVVKLLHDFADMVAPELILLTETNVPHDQNVSYFGKRDEAHMVYQFSLPPLLLHALLAENSSYLTAWAKSLKDPPKGCTFFNFTASHDGIGVKPLQGVLPEEEILWLCQKVRERRGLISTKRNPDGSESPYELNITYRSALGDPDDEELGVERFLCSQALAASMKGIPGVYFNSLVGDSNFHEGVELTSQPRTINRRKWNAENLEANLDDPETVEATIFRCYSEILRGRRAHRAFHPDGGQVFVDLGAEFFGLTRRSADGTETVCCVYNFTRSEKEVDLIGAFPALSESETLTELLSSRSVSLEGARAYKLEPFEACWIT